MMWELHLFLALCVWRKEVRWSQRSGWPTDASTVGIRSSIKHHEEPHEKTGVQGNVQLHLQSVQP